MCGIVGLHLKTGALEDRLGRLMTQMLEAMTTRGPDSAGIALYDDGWQGACRYSLRWRAGYGEADWDALARRMAADLGVDVAVHRCWDDRAVLTAGGDDDRFRERVRACVPEVRLVGFGQAMEVLKDTGSPRDVCERFGVRERAGYQGVGHTRMATESAVTTDHSHPFAPAADLCLVHNGSFSNYASVRRDLSDAGIGFDTDNDSEVAARFLALRLGEGSDLGDALRSLCKELDGFFTLLVATRTSFAVVRDAFACKPAVIAETGDYVAMASEYQALAGLPGIADADVFEPMPEEIYLWSR